MTIGTQCATLRVAQGSSSLIRARYVMTFRDNVVLPFQENHVDNAKTSEHGPYIETGPLFISRIYQWYPNSFCASPCFNGTPCCVKIKYYTALTSLVPKARQHRIRHDYTNTNDTIWNIRMSYPSIVEYMNKNIAILCKWLSRSLQDVQRIPLFHGLSINDTIAYDSYFRCGDGKESNCAG